MRLLKLSSDDKLSFTKDILDESEIPRYAILSHTWLEDQEVTFDAFLDDNSKSKAGYEKIRFCAQQAKRDGLEYFWVDTCCINKRNPVELQDAINSMFRWYQKATHCYVYMADVSTGKRKADSENFHYNWEPAFRQSRWFTRGWTLQELLAPCTVTFFSREGTWLGDKRILEQQVHETTGIPIRALRGTPLHEFSKEDRLAWAEGRHTTRKEDRAYSLQGIFGVIMAPLYGEGEDNAFRRLHRKIAKSSGDKVDNDQRRILLDSLRFDQIHARQMTIKNAYAKTCRWLLKNQQYLDWLNEAKLGEHHGFLWIKGKAGAGKSTLMKFVFLNACKTMKERSILSFFFNARGEDMEKSAIGAYRSLLLQLLERLPELQSTFDLLGLSVSSISTDQQWTIELLKTLLEHALQALGESRVVCFIDALDECEEEQVRDMIRFFEGVGEIAVSKNIRIHVCFSSRHYPHVTIERGLELVLEGQEGHTQDIANYVKTELKIGQSKIAQEIRSELQEKASGIFMWVVLVVDILNKVWDRGQIHTLRQKLKEIPSNLHELFRDILTRDSHNKESLVLCIQWILFAKQPLSPEQLYHAILSGIEPDAVSAWDSELITEDVLKRFILDCSKGLVDTTMSRKQQKVQFIHESVRDFLLKENGLGQIWPELSSNFLGQSHEQLKQCCSSYINLNVVASLNVPSNHSEASSQDLASMSTLARQRLPLLEYAVRNLLHHADTAEGSGVSQKHFLDSFPTPYWVKLDNLFERHKVRRHRESVSCLYLLAEFNMANLMKLCLSADQCLAVEDERYGCPLFAAAATGSEDALEMCMKAIRIDRGTEEPLHLEDATTPQRGLAKGTSRREFVYSKHKDFLINAAELGHDGVLTYMLSWKEYENKIDSIKDSRDRTVLWWASKTGCKNAVRFLLARGSTIVHSKDKDQKTPLHIAVDNQDEVLVKLLLDTGKVDLEAKNDSRERLLLSVAKSRNKEIVKLLLDTGKVDVNAKDKFGESFLLWAAQKGNKEIVKLLLDTGKVDVNAKNKSGETALLWAAVFSHEATAKLLLDTGKVDVDAKDGYYGGTTALWWAARNGSGAIVKLLLDKGADVNKSSRYGQTALQVAAERGKDAVVRLLLDRGAVNVL